eukprot:scaffold66865_cov16-Tisochrysis_lutea.AAC.1
MMQGLFDKHFRGLKWKEAQGITRDERKTYNLVFWLFGRRWRCTFTQHKKVYKLSGEKDLSKLVVWSGMWHIPASPTVPQNKLVKREGYKRGRSTRNTGWDAESLREEEGWTSGRMHRARSLSLSPDFANKTRMHRNCSTRADAWKGDNTIVLGHLQGLGAYRGRHAMTADDRCGEEFESQSPGWESGVSRRGNQSSGGSCSSLSRGSCK